ncbi:hypothetical protein ABT061_16675 [Streptosporangium sp. NPDC002544]|uniref:hypothetical protein n=1 Tax=Streptosporangium sp. NPDC002544 TaxID=3154538 RepID=UPI0033174D1F
MSRLRACWTAQAPVWFAVTPRMCTRLVATSITNRTYRRFKEIVSTWKKSQVSSPFAWVRRNVRHEVSMFREAGPGRLAGFASLSLH